MINPLVISVAFQMVGLTNNPLPRCMSWMESLEKEQV